MQSIGKFVLIAISNESKDRTQKYLIVGFISLSQNKTPT